MPGLARNYNRYTDRPNSKITNCLDERGARSAEIGTMFVESHGSKRWRELLDRRFRGWDIGHMSRSACGHEILMGNRLEFPTRRSGKKKEFRV